MHFASEMQYLNTNYSLYSALVKAEQDAHLLSEEAQRAAKHLRLDFEKGGIHLSHGWYPLSSNSLYFIYLLTN